MERGLKLSEATERASAEEPFSSNDTKELSMMLMDHFTQTTKALSNAGGFSFSLFGKTKLSESQMALVQQMGELSQGIKQGRAGNRELLEFFRAETHGGAAPTAEPSSAAHVQHSQPSAGASSSSTNLMTQMQAIAQTLNKLKEFGSMPLDPALATKLISTMSEDNAALSKAIESSGRLDEKQGRELKKDTQDMGTLLEAANSSNSSKSASALASLGKTFMAKLLTANNLPTLEKAGNHNDG